MFKQSDEVYGLSAGPFGFFQAEFLDCWCEVSKVPSDPWHEAEDVEIVYHESLYVGQC